MGGVNLRECPFCGASVNMEIERGVSSRNIWIKCTKCDIQTTKYRVVTPIEQEEIIAMWNSRTKARKSSDRKVGE